MKRIRALNTAPDGLAEYIQNEPGSGTWADFRDHDAGRSYGELVSRLIELQHGLCCYCEIALRGSDRQVEHVVPRSEPSRGPAATLDAGNLAACCKGGSARSFAENGLTDEDRYVKPVSPNLSCGQAKGNTSDARFIDPRELPALPSLVQVSRSGKIAPDPAACRSQGVAVDRVERTIDILGLNARRLQRARRKARRKLSRAWGTDVENGPRMATAAKLVLLPDDAGRLAAFFTTSRTYFGAAAERVLVERPRDWI